MFLKSVAKFLWGDLNKTEVKHIGLLAITYLLIVGSYGLLDPVKYALFLKLVGKDYLPYAKIVSFGLIVPSLLLYSKAIDWFSKDKLFYIVCTFYVTVFLILIYLLSFTPVEIRATNSVFAQSLGWIFFAVTESCTSIIIALFFSLVVSVTSTTTAKKGFPLIAAGAQVGAILGPTTATYASSIGILSLPLIACCCLLLAAFLVKIFMKLTQQQLLNTTEAKKPTPGILTGIKLIFSDAYVLGIFGLIAFYGIVGTILDYQLKYVADITFKSPIKLVEFFGMCGQASNLLSLVLALIGTSFLVRKLGLTACLFIFPAATLLVVLYIMFNPGIWSLFGALLIFRGLTYGFNNPNKEILYIPTSSDVKFKAKSWIDVFGSRLSKAMGSGTNASLVALGIIGTGSAVTCIVILAFWLPLSLWVGTTNKKLCATQRQDT